MNHAIGAVDAFLAALDHPRKAEIEALRGIILGADARIEEGIKWNAPSFRTTEWFATFHLRAKDSVRIILHLGAKVRAGAEVVIADPESMLKWLAKDRASADFRDMAGVEARGGAFAKIIQQWMEHV
ncbi:MAG TPA: DUF1801 domain-containing protein [Longimicrobium sp.]|nr:DUF1801 domain-containing protein [Longimicrobium sp.]